MKEHSSMWFGENAAIDWKIWGFFYIRIMNWLYFGGKCVTQNRNNRVLVKNNYENNNEKTFNSQMFLRVLLIMSYMQCHQQKHSKIFHENFLYLQNIIFFFVYFVNHWNTELLTSKTSFRLRREKCSVKSTNCDGKDARG